MKYIKTYETCYKPPLYYSFYDDMVENHQDVDYFLKFRFKKMKKNPSIIAKLTEMEKNVLDSYVYQKLILNIIYDNQF